MKNSENLIFFKGPSLGRKREMTDDGERPMTATTDDGDDRRWLSTAIKSRPLILLKILDFRKIASFWKTAKIWFFSKVPPLDEKVEMTDDGDDRRRRRPTTTIDGDKISSTQFAKNLGFQKNCEFFSKIFSKMSGRDFIAVDGRRPSSPSSVVAVVRHFHFFVQGRDLWKISDFRCLSKKITIFLKSKIFSKMSGRDFIVVDGRRRSSPSSVVAVVRHFHFFVQGRDLWKKSDFRCFSKKLTIFLKYKIFSKMSGRDFIAVDGRRPSLPSSVVAVVRHFHFFVQGRDLWKKIRFSLFFKKTHNFSEIQDF